MLRWMIVFQKCRMYMTITHRPGKIDNNTDGLSRMASPNNSNTDHGDHFRRLDEKFVSDIANSYRGNAKILELVKILSQQAAEPSLSNHTRGTLANTFYEEGIFALISGLLYCQEKHTAVIVMDSVLQKQQILDVCHDDCCSGHIL